MNFFKKKKVALPIEDDYRKKLLSDYLTAVADYNAAVDNYNYAGCGDCEPALYNAMILAKEKVENMVRLIRLNSDN